MNQIQEGGLKIFVIILLLGCAVGLMMGLMATKGQSNENHPATRKAVLELIQDGDTQEYTITDKGGRFIYQLKRDPFPKFTAARQNLNHLGYYAFLEGGGIVIWGKEAVFSVRDITGSQGGNLDEIPG